MTNTTLKEHVRPYWHVDAKWIFGILLSVSLGACLLVYNLSTLTVRDQAVPLSAGIVASLFSKNGIDDPSGLEELKQQAAALPDNAVLTPLSQFPSIHITKEQVLTLSPSDLRVDLFSQLTGEIYDKGLAQAAAELTSDPSQQQTFINQASPLGILTQANHDVLQRIWIALGIVSLIFLGLMMYFSAGWGRLVSPAVVTLAISPVGTLGGLLVMTLATNHNPVSNYVPDSVLNALGASLLHSYGIAAMIAGGLLVVALIGKVVTHVVRRTEAKKPAFLKE